MEKVAIIVGLISCVIATLSIASCTVSIIIDTIKSWRLKRGN